MTGIHPTEEAPAAPSEKPDPVHSHLSVTAPTLAEQRLAALAKGRATAAANRAARAAAPKTEPAPPVVRRSASTEPNADLEGLTEADCANDCRDGYCVITGQNHCGHPNKGGIQAAHQMVPKIKQTYIRAKKHLAHLAVDRK